MLESLSPGRWRGLQTTSTAHHVFTVMAFDQRGNYVRMLPDGVPHAQAAALKYEIVSALAPHTSAVLLDPIYGAQAALMGVGHSGLLLCIEATGYTGDSTYRRTEFIPGWNVAKIKQMGASAAKLLIYYHPESGSLAEEIETLVAQVAEDCHRHDLPLFVEPLCYSLDAAIAKDSAEFARLRPVLVRETARRLCSLGVDVLKLEFPIDAKYNADQAAWLDACQAISAVSTVPWVLLSAGVDFDTFEQQVGVACEAGASGFLGGRAIWKECVSMSPTARAQFLAATGTARLDALTAIANDTARPWTDFYAPPAVGENWYMGYAPELEPASDGQD